MTDQDAGQKLQSFRRDRRTSF